MKVKRGYYDVFVRTCAKHPSSIAVRYYDNGVYKNYTYSELYGVCEYITQILQQLQCNKGVIGLVSERNIIIPCVIAAAHKCCTTFMFVDPDQDVELISKEIGFNVVITVKNQDNDENSDLFGKKPEHTVSVFDLCINFYHCDIPSAPATAKHSQIFEQYSFIAQTSGSTGQPKHIQVPLQCIQPNIDDLTDMFNITPEDIIYFSTPLTFDPSMIEILLACMNGASLLIAPNQTNILFPDDKKKSVTFWQTTPSRFLQHTNSEISKILGPNSSLKTLALGGEPFNGVKRLRELKHGDNKTRIFALYGVTEMSCWASVTEVDLDKIQHDREIPLGNCLSETQIVIDQNTKNNNSGKIMLVSKTRKCVILNKSKGDEEENCLKFVDTGDIGEVRRGTIYYQGRTDDIIKRFGHKVNLQYIEHNIMQCPRVKTCACLWLPKPMILAVYYSSESLTSQELADFLKCKLDDRHWPDQITRVDFLPTNNHGKISKQLLALMYERTAAAPLSSDSYKMAFLKELKSALNRNFVYDQIKNRDFFSLGGTSFLAITMCNRLSSEYPKFGKLVLPYLMSQTFSIDEILQMVQQQLLEDPEEKPKKRPKRRRSGSATITSEVSTKKSSVTTHGRVEFSVVWTYNTGRCVDATPELFQFAFNLYVVVGSHSGQVVIVDAVSGVVQGSLTLKTRIEASVLCCLGDDLPTPCGVVGGYDGTIVCFSLDDCDEIWRTNIGWMIKSKAVRNKGQLYIASYDGAVRCIDLLNGDVLQTIEVSDQAISADLVLAKNQFILLGTLSGVCACIYSPSNDISWRCKLESPVFASPVLYDNDKYVLFAEVGGGIHCRTVEKGIKIWRYDGVKGNIFSSIFVKRIDKIKWQMVFGCHDKAVYSIHVKNFQPSLHWKTPMTSPVYSTPCSLNDKMIVAASNNGKLCILDSEHGSIIEEYNLPDETFSSPVIFSDYIFIGCRNDHLYSIKLNSDL